MCSAHYEAVGQALVPNYLLPCPPISADVPSQLPWLAMIVGRLMIVKSQPGELDCGLALQSLRL